VLHCCCRCSAARRGVAQGARGGCSCSSSVSSQCSRQQQQLAGGYRALQLGAPVRSAAGHHAAAGRRPASAGTSSSSSSRPKPRRACSVTLTAAAVLRSHVWQGCAMAACALGCWAALCAHVQATRAAVGCQATTICCGVLQERSNFPGFASLLAYCMTFRLYNTLVCV
jgi:hypothetical protein